MPQLGETVTEGTITRWFKQVGDHVGMDEILFEISTDKVDSEVPSPVAGTLTEIFAGEGDLVEVGQVLARIGDPAAAPVAAPQPAEPQTAPAPAPHPAGQVAAEPRAWGAKNGRGRVRLRRSLRGRSCRSRGLGVRLRVGSRLRPSLRGRSCRSRGMSLRPDPGPRRQPRRLSYRQPTAPTHLRLRPRVCPRPPRRPYQPLTLGPTRGQGAPLRRAR
ncbi:MAG: lipoyl domain-containing protein [Acidimicrobiia bacterium]|nr:lipoyl domain-containing protein [Acidimicrobiia bacterium]